MKTAYIEVLMLINMLSPRYLCLLLLSVAGCAVAFDKPARVLPTGPHDQVADRAFCRDYAERYGVINLGPMMGEKTQNQPDRQRRNRLFVICMEEKGYLF